MTTELAPASVALREAPAATGSTLHGHFSKFNQWTQIHSAFEGHFVERFARGAFAATIREDRAKMRVLFQHGGDPELGDKPLGRITTLREDDVGARYEVALYDGLPGLLLAGLRDRAYGASFRFQALREDINHHAAKSAHNPDALPERTVLEASVREFGPVTFPAYDGATADLRSREARPETIARRRILRGDEKVTPVRPLTISGAQLRPGRSRLLVSHPWVRRQPRDFRPVWTGDSETRAQLDRMRGSTRVLTSRSRPSWRLPSTRPAAPWRLP